MQGDQRSQAPFSPPHTIHTSLPLAKARTLQNTGVPLRRHFLLQYSIIYANNYNDNHRLSWPHRLLPRATTPPQEATGSVKQYYLPAARATIDSTRSRLLRYKTTPEQQCLLNVHSQVCSAALLISLILTIPKTTGSAAHTFTIYNINRLHTLSHPFQCLLCS